MNRTDVVADGTNVTSNIRPYHNNNFLTYENPTYGITMQYPSDWRKSETVMKIDNQTTGIVKFKNPPGLLGLGEVGIIVIDVKTNTSLEQFLSDDIYSHIDLRDFRILESNTVSSLGNHPAYILATTYTTDKGLHAKVREVGTVVMIKPS